jgi:hypothetical protein
MKIKPSNMNSSCLRWHCASKKRKKQTKLLHKQVTFLAKFIELKRAEQMDHLEQTAENVETGNITKENNPEVNQLCAAFDDFRTVASMRPVYSSLGCLHESCQLHPCASRWKKASVLSRV